MSRINIGLTGAGGTGKGTLSRALQKAFMERGVQINVIPSYIQEITKKIAPNSSNYNDMTIMQKYVQQYSIVMAQYNAELLISKTDVKNFISERSLLDYIPYFIQAITSYDHNSIFTHKNLHKYADMIYNIIRDGQYTHIVILPFEFENTKEDLKENKWKERDAATKKNTEKCIRRALKVIGTTPGKCPKIIEVTGTVEERVEQCINEILPSGAVAAPIKNLCG